MNLTLIATENVPPRLRGYLAVWMVEVRSGLYVAKLSARKREGLWDASIEMAGDGNVVLVWTTNSETGYKIRAHGDNRRQPVDFDGLTLMRVLD